MKTFLICLIAFFAVVLVYLFVLSLCAAAAHADEQAGRQEWQVRERGGD